MGQSISRKTVHQKYPPASPEEGYACDDTQLGSRAAANTWWTEKKAEIDAGNVIFALDTGRQLKRFQPTETELARFRFQRYMLENYGPINPQNGTKTKRAPVTSDRQLFNATDRDRGYWEAKSEDRKAIKPTETVVAQIEAYLNWKRVQASAGEVAEKSLPILKYRLDICGEILGLNTPVQSIDGPAVSKVYSALSEKVASGEWKAWTVKSIYQQFKAWVRWLYESQELIEQLPKNLAKLSFYTPETDATVLDFEPIRKLYKGASDRCKLYILLGCNMGFTSTPMSIFDRTKIVDGRYHYKRQKTKKHQSVPRVGYKLWPETEALLESVVIPAKEKQIEEQF